VETEHNNYQMLSKTTGGYHRVPQSASVCGRYWVLGCCQCWGAKAMAMQAFLLCLMDGCATMCCVHLVGY
jgi:hypothetical protein